MSYDYRDYDGNIANEDAKKRAIEEGILIERSDGTCYDRYTGQVFWQDNTKRENG